MMKMRPIFILDICTYMLYSLLLRRLLGLCNNFPYVVMLSAAFDILTKVEKKSSNPVSLCVCTFVCICSSYVYLCTCLRVSEFVHACVHAFIHVWSHYRWGPTIQWIIVNYSLIIVMAQERTTQAIILIGSVIRSLLGSVIKYHNHILHVHVCR